MLDNTSLISVAILNKNIDCIVLQNLHDTLATQFKYFEILLINPSFVHLESKKTNVVCSSKSPPPPQKDLLLHLEPNLPDSENRTLSNLRIISARMLSEEVKYLVFLQNCIGDYILFMDLEQNSIQDSQTMLTQARLYDVVVGSRITKHQGIIDKFFSYIFYKLISMCGSMSIKHSYSEFCVFNRKTIHYLLNQDESIKLLSLVQFDESFSKYEHRFIPLKKSNKKFLQSLNLGIDIIFQGSHRLLRAASILSIFVAFFNLVYGIYIFLSFMFRSHIEGGWTSSSMYMAGMNFCLFLVLCIMSEYIRSILLHVKKHNLYDIVDEKSSLDLDFKELNVRDK
ncbi:glycosyl transferase [Helicobacter trogontum]|uniref:Glycosyl transferase n=1 Tax=Helicobacter trogontum TaxID=50960 RepID=A0A4U8TDK0_9HELI|nr:glycosyl transferase [Helicobacter trogontum]MDY5184592.1 glycosyl transferase [Helicobacter trogontum]TLD98089.1 glycosyl transferase [Helicobacter trogontum]